MITRLHVENYKCLRDVTVDLGPFTVLIGANDSGKSSVLDAIRVLGRTTSETLAASLAPEDGGGEGSFAELVWRQDDKLEMTFAVTGATADKTLGYALKLRSRGPVFEIDERLVGTNCPAIDTSKQTATRTSLAVMRQQQPARAGGIEEILPLFASSIKYRLDPRALRESRPFQSNAVLHSSGDNLPQALDALMTGPDRNAIVELEKALHTAVPTLSGVSLRTLNVPGGISKEVLFTLAGTNPKAVTVRTANLSEGALLLTAFLILAYGESPEILLVEEPENGLHPTRLQTVIDLLRAISTGAVGNRPRQVIMTTHSPLLLNYVRPEEVRIVRRDPELGTSVTPMTAVPNLDKLLKEFAVGELWYLLTEEGLLRGEHP